jgi:thiol-disulfide isomerase/thioredoxin
MKTTIKLCQRIGNPIKQWENLIVCLVLIITFTACTQHNTVTGHIKGLTNDTIFVDVSSVENFEDDPVRDTIIAKNGKFEYTFLNNGMYGLQFSFPQFFVLNRPTGGLYTPDNSLLAVFVEQGNKIRIKGETNSVGLCNVRVSGSIFNRDYSLIQSKLFDININQVKEEMALEQAMVDRNKEAEDIGWANRRERLNTRRELFSNYIRTNLDNPLSAFLLLHLPLDSASIYAQLGENARNSMFSRVLDDFVERYKEYTIAMKAKEEVVVGSTVPDFTLNDTNGKPFTLSSLRGKYVIVDFWGSWCGPCIVGIPKMKSAYEKFKNKLEIVGVACREESIDAWQNAVNQHKLPWINVYDDKLTAINVKYGIEAYPTKIVIDPKGTIIIRERGEGEEFYTKLESVIK